MRLEVRPHAEVELPKFLSIVAIGADGHAILTGQKSFAVVGPSGSVALHEQVAVHVAAIDRSDAGRVAVLELTASGPRVNVIEPDGHRHTFDAAPDRRSTFDMGTGGAILWAGEDELWLGGEDRDGEILVRVVGAASGEVRAEVRLRDPYAESAVRFRPGPSESTCFLNLNARQHGVWGHSIERTNASLSTRALASGGWVIDEYAIDAESTLCLEEDAVVLRSSSDQEIARSRPLARASPYTLSRASRGRALVQTAWGVAVLVDESSLELVAELAITPPRDALRELCAHGPHLVATCSTSRFDHTRVLLARLPD